MVVKILHFIFAKEKSNFSNDIHERKHIPIYPSLWDGSIKLHEQMLLNWGFIPDSGSVIDWNTGSLVVVLYGTGSTANGPYVLIKQKLNTTTYY